MVVSWAEISFGCNLVQHFHADEIECAVPCFLHFSSEKLGTMMSKASVVYSLSGAVCSILRHAQQRVVGLQPLAAYTSMPKVANASLSQQLRSCSNKPVKTSDNLEGKKQESSGNAEKVQLPVGGRLMIQFTCKVCNHRQSKTFSKKSYYSGVVIIRCDGCRNLHLIADNLGWFKDVKRWTIEDILRERGESLQKLVTNEDGTLEISGLSISAADSTQSKDGDDSSKNSQKS